ncbi:hypothetical protein DOFOFD_04040 [Acetobacteraceae bacterium EV16P]|uniref:DHHA1 domain-containing protein n=1 Tax=Sorlinia euscelidii TaxID=3081148 RepID=A0ABU7U063_9PROT
MAAELDDINARRRDVESAILIAAEAQAEAQIAGGARFIFVHDPSWHPGIVGIVAGRLKERFNCPVFVGAEKDGVIKGSARSIPGLDVGLAVINARQKNLLTTGGGMLWPRVLASLQVARRICVPFWTPPSLRRPVSRALLSCRSTR